MSGIVITRGKAREEDGGNLTFMVTVRAEDKARFFAEFPGFDLTLESRGELKTGVAGYAEFPDFKSDNPATPAHDDLVLQLDPPQPPPDTPPAQGIGAEGCDTFALGRPAAPNIDVVHLCEGPPFQEYAALSLPAEKRAEIEDSFRFALDFAQVRAGKPLAKMGREDYIALLRPFQQWCQINNRTQEGV